MDDHRHIPRARRRRAALVAGACLATVLPAVLPTGASAETPAPAMPTTALPTSASGPATIETRALEDAPGLIASITWDDRVKIELTDPTTGISRDLWRAPDTSTSIYDIEWRPGGRSLTALTARSSATAGSTTYTFRLVDIAVATGAATTLYESSYVYPPAFGPNLYSFSWMPDGRRALVSWDDGTSDPNTQRIRLLDVDTDTLTSLSGLSGYQWGAQVSPTGEWTLISGTTPGSTNTWGLWLRNRDGSSRRTIFDNASWWWNGWDAWYGYGWYGYESGAAWSPDGTQLVIPRGDVDRRSASLWAYDIATRDTEELVTARADQSLMDPAWSPDGRYLAYSSYDWSSTTGDVATIVRDLRTGETVRFADRRNYWNRWDLEWQPVSVCTLPDERPEDGPGEGRSADTRADADGSLNVTVGDWLVSGCLSGTGRSRSTASEVMVNGMTLTPRDGATIRVDTSTKRLTSTGPVRVRLVGRDGGLPVGPIALFDGRLDWDLSKGSVSFDVKHLFDAPLVDERLVVRAVSPGRGAIVASIKVPFLLGRSTVPLDRIELTNTRGLGAAAFRWEADRDPSITQLIPLQGTVVEYDPRTKKWMVRAMVSGNSVKPSLSFDHEKGKLRRARFGIERLDLFGLATLRDVAISYQRTAEEGGVPVERYTFTARIPAGNSTDTLDGFLVYRDGQLTEFRAQADLAKLLQIVQVRNFDLHWTKEDGWNGSGRIVAGDAAVGSAADITLELTSQSNRVIGGQLRAPLIRLGSPGNASLQIEDLQVSYAVTGGPTGGERNVWSGQMRLRLPGPDAPAVGGSVTFVEGKLTRARAEAQNVRIGPGFILRQVAADVELDPLALSGTVTAQVGPDLPGAPPATVVGELSFRKGASATASDRYAVRGTVTIGNASLADASVSYLTSGRSTIEGALRWDIPGLGLTGAKVVGYADDDELVLTGRVRIGFGDGRLDGRVMITNEGLTACVDLPGIETRTGFSYRWDGTLTRFSAACDLGRLDVPDTASGRPRAGGTEVTVPRRVDAFAIAVSGAGNAPVLRITGPGGAVVTTSATGDGLLDARALSWTDRRNGITYVTLVKPAAGTWRISTEPGSPAIRSVRVARPLPDPTVTGSVSGSGSSRSLAYRIGAVDGQTVTFIERWDGGQAVLGDASGTSGRLAFAPAPGPGGTRTIVALVSQNGFLRAETRVTSYSTGPVAPRCTPQKRCNTTITLATQTQGSLLYAGGVVTPARPGGTVLLKLVRGSSPNGPVVFDLPTVIGTDGRYADYFTGARSRTCTLVATYLGDASYQPATTKRSVRC